MNDAIGDWQYAWRGWILGTLFLVLAVSRWFSGAPVLPAALGLVALGSAYRLYAGRFIPGHSNALGLAGDTLALEGPYRFGRHPLYLSNLAVIIGLVLFANSLPPWGSAALVLLAALHHSLLARAEERFLARTRGEVYVAYLRETPRWFGAPASRGAARLPASSNSDDTWAAWKRQGGNLGKTAVCVLVLWALAVSGR